MSGRFVAQPARILVVDDDPAIRKIVRDRFAAKGHELAVAASGDEAIQQVEEFDPQLMILDLRMPGMDGFDVLSKLVGRGRPDVVVITAHGSIESAVRAIQLGAVDFIPKPFETVHLEHVVERILERSRLFSRVERLEHELSGRHVLVMGESSALRHITEIAERAAPSDATVLLLGESGTGKEVMARYIHAKSKRAGGPFVALNCATLSEELLASELFGHEKGAFTGASRTKMGRIEQAAGGTLFLDEVGEIPPGVQAKLLRVLQEREFERVGGTRGIRADVRILAATNRDLRAAIADGRFREDLFYRLNVVSVSLPPLRERREDLPLLIDHFLERHVAQAHRASLAVSPEARRLLLEHDWPGNVRELSNVIERAVVLAARPSIGVEDLPEELRARPASPTPPREPGARVDEGAGGDAAASTSYQDAVNDAKRRIIRAALERSGNHQTRAAEMLGLSQPYLARLMKNLGLSMKKPS